MRALFAFAFGFVGMLAVFVLISLLLIKFGWALFMVPVFGLHELSWTQAFGFALLASAFRSNSTKG